MRLVHLEEGVVKTSEDPELAVSLHKAGKSFWLLLDAHEAGAEAVLRDVLGIHPLTIEDVWHESELPKIEDFDEYLHVVVHTITQTESLDIELHEVDFLLGSSFLITRSPSRELLEGVCGDLERCARLLKKGPVWVVHAILDRLVDAYIPVIDRYDERIFHLEDQLMEVAGTSAGKQVLSEILRLKRGLAAFRRMSVHQREILFRLSRGEFDEVPRELTPFFRDVFDHFARVVDLADAHRELLSGLLEAYLSVQSNRMNEVMKTLTLFSTVMMPLTFIAGVYGMNFEFMPELHRRWGYPAALLFMLFVGIGIYVWFRFKKWL